jgi:hypothetical protein
MAKPLNHRQINGLRKQGCSEGHELKLIKQYDDAQVVQFVLIDTKVRKKTPTQQFAGFAATLFGPFKK